MESTGFQANQHTPDVSVIIPVYNCEDYIAETLESIFDQSLSGERVEVIAVDDGSEDSSRQILYSYASRHPNMQVISMANSGSASAPRNAGLDAARGRYVFFVDADDRLETFTLASLVSTADEHDSDIVLCKLGEFGAAKRALALPTRAFKRSQFSVDYIDSMAYTTLCVLKLMRRSIIEASSVRFPLGYRVGEDQPFMMETFFNARSVSILADKVYYWARGRGDGTNATSAGQTPDKNYIKNITLIRTIADGPEVERRRALLLERPVMGRSGLKTVFGAKFLESFTDRERARMVEEVAEIVEPMWSEDLRSMGPLESQVLMELILRRDLSSVESASALLRDKKPIPLYFDHEREWFSYLPPAGDPIENLLPRLETMLSTIAPNAGGIKLTGRSGVVGADSAPECVNTVWKHRKTKNEVHAPVVTGRTIKTKAGTAIEFESTVSLTALDNQAEWDLFVECQWGNTTVRERTGNKKAGTIDTATTLVGAPVKAALLFTRHGNLTIDMGPVRKYPGAQHHVGYTVKGHFALGRDLVILVTGDVDANDVITVVTENAKPLIPKQVSLIDEDCIAVVFPKTVQNFHGSHLRIVHEGSEDLVELPFT